MGDNIININDLKNPWKNSRQVQITLLSEYLNDNYKLPYNLITGKYYWKKNEYPINADGTCTQWTATNPPKTPDN